MESIIEEVQPKIYHIHTDTWDLDLEFYQFLKSLGFTDTDFSGRVQGDTRQSESFIFHKTLKLTSKKVFVETWNKVVEEGQKYIVKGYFEGEIVSYDIPLVDVPYTNIPLPFEITRRLLKGSPEEPFRDIELHLTIDTKSNQKLVEKLLGCGMYGALMPKKDYIAIVLTTQGLFKNFHLFFNILKAFLEKSGGTIRGTLKEEIVLRHWLQGITPRELPEIGEVSYFEDRMTGDMRSMYRTALKRMEREKPLNKPKAKVINKL